MEDLVISPCDGTRDWCWARLLNRHDQRAGVVFGGVGEVNIQREAEVGMLAQKKKGSVGLALISVLF